MLGGMVSEIDSKMAIDILERNFGYDVVETEFGKAIKMSAYDAFLYSNVTGAGYLDNSLMPFSPKGLMKVFYNAFDYNFVTGLFDGSFLKNTPRNLHRLKPFLFDGDKYLLFEEFEKEQDLQNRLSGIIKTCIDEGADSRQYVVHRVETSKNGNGMESFMEYIACEYFKKYGLIVENQIPLTADVGSPDFGAYSLASLDETNPFIECFNTGFHIIELAMLFLNRHSPNDAKNYLNGNIVGEAKTSTFTMRKQLDKYLKTGLFKMGFELHPFKKNPSDEGFGLLSFADNYISLSLPKKKTFHLKIYSLREYEKWLNNYCKYYLIANLTNDELSEYMLREFHTNRADQKTLIEHINSMDLKALLKYIMEKSHVIGLVE